MKKQWMVYVMIGLAIQSKVGLAYAQKAENVIGDSGHYFSGSMGESDDQSDKIRSGRKSARELSWQGESLRKQGKIAAAVATLKKALTYDSRHPIAQEQLAEIYADQGKWRESVAMYGQLMDENKVGWSNGLENDFPHLVRYSLALHNARMLSSAKVVYQKALTVAPDRLTPYLYVPESIVALDTKRMVASLHLALSDVLKYRASGVGDDLKSEKMYAERLREAKAAVTAAPNYAPAHLMLAEVLTYQSQRESFYKKPGNGEATKREAAQAYKRAIALGKGDTRIAAQKGLQGYWFADMTTPKP